MVTHIKFITKQLSKAKIIFNTANYFYLKLVSLKHRTSDGIDIKNPLNNEKRMNIKMVIFHNIPGMI